MTNRTDISNRQERHPMSTETTYEDLKEALAMGDLDYDPWGTVMGAFFQVCKVLYATRFVGIPEEWGFRPGAGVATLSEIEDPMMFELIKADDDTLIRFGHLLNRYAGMLKASGRSY